MCEDVAVETENDAVRGEPPGSVLSPEYPGASVDATTLDTGDPGEPLDLAARARMVSLRQVMFGVSAGPVRIGRFILRETLGAGGMGIVYAAHDPQLDRRIALKLVKPDGGQTAKDEARLTREAKSMARLSHPNVVQIHEIGVWEGRVFIAMELVAGRTLAAWLSTGERNWREIVAIFLEAGGPHDPRISEEAARRAPWLASTAERDPSHVGAEARPLGRGEGQLADTPLPHVADTACGREDPRADLGGPDAGGACEPVERRLGDVLKAVGSGEAEREAVVERRDVEHRGDEVVGRGEPGMPPEDAEARCSIDSRRRSPSRRR